MTIWDLAVATAGDEALALGEKGLEAVREGARQAKQRRKNVRNAKKLAAQVRGGEDREAFEAERSALGAHTKAWLASDDSHTVSAVFDDVNTSDEDGTLFECSPPDDQLIYHNGEHLCCATRIGENEYVFPLHALTDIIDDSQFSVEIGRPGNDVYFFVDICDEGRDQVTAYAVGETKFPITPIVTKMTTTTATIKTGATHQERVLYVLNSRWAAFKNCWWREGCSGMPILIDGEAVGIFVGYQQEDDIGIVSLFPSRVETIMNTYAKLGVNSQPSYVACGRRRSIMYGKPMSDEAYQDMQVRFSDYYTMQHGREPVGRDFETFTAFARTYLDDQDRWDEDDYYSESDYDDEYDRDDDEDFRVVERERYDGPSLQDKRVGRMLDGARYRPEYVAAGKKKKGVIMEGAKVSLPDTPDVTVLVTEQPRVEEAKPHVEEEKVAEPAPPMTLRWVCSECKFSNPNKRHECAGEVDGEPCCAPRPEPAPLIPETWSCPECKHPNNFKRIQCVGLDGDCTYVRQAPQVAVALPTTRKEMTTLRNRAEVDKLNKAIEEIEKEGYRLSNVVALNEVELEAAKLAGNEVVALKRKHLQLLRSHKSVEKAKAQRRDASEREAQRVQRLLDERVAEVESLRLKLEELQKATGANF